MADNRSSRGGDRRPSGAGRGSQGPRSGGSRPSGSRSGDSRSSGSRSGAPRSFESRSSAPRSGSDRPRSAAPRRDDDRRTSSDRPRASAPRRDDDRRGSSDRPRSSAPRSGSDRPRRDDDRRTSSDRPRSSAPRRDDNRRASSDRPRSSAPRSASDRPRSAAPRRDDDRRTGGPRDASARRSRTEGRPTDSGRQRPVGRPDVRGGRERLGDVESKFVPVAADIDIKILPKQVLAELRNISPSAAEFVSKHLAAAMYALEDDDAQRAYDHAIAARSRAARLASVREMCGLAAYYSEKWSEALNEFRTYQRLTGDPHFLPLMADCERGLGRPMRALQIARSEQVRSLNADTRIELRIVASGARRDLGQMDAAIATLECPELNGRGHSEAVIRLKYAYAEALLAANRLVEARDWFVKTALADVDDMTDAADRALEINA